MPCEYTSDVAISGGVANSGNSPFVGINQSLRDGSYSGYTEVYNTGVANDITFNDITFEVTCLRMGSSRQPAGAELAIPPVQASAARR